VRSLTCNVLHAGLLCVNKRLLCEHGRRELIRPAENPGVARTLLQWRPTGLCFLFFSFPCLRASSPQEKAEHDGPTADTTGGGCGPDDGRGAPGAGGYQSTEPAAASHAGG